VNATRRAGLVVLLMIAAYATASAQAPKLIRSLSGPSGKIVGARFEFDETRNRFVYPQDRALTVYFEWECPAGDHVLVASWKQPDGRVASVSPDVRIQTTAPQLNSYWIFDITPSLAPGTWTVEVRIDGQPAGSHAFEIAGVEAAKNLITLDRVFTLYGPSVVRVHKLDDAGRRFDTSSGFVVAPNTIATAFQSIDTAARLDVEFGDGHHVQTDAVLAVSRLDDWAILKADTGAVPPIPLGDAQAVPVGAHLAAITLDADTRTVVPVSVGAVSAPPGYGARIRFQPDASRDSLGGPLIDERGRAVGILGGSQTPGSRFGTRLMDQNEWMYRLRPDGNAATAIGNTLLTLPAAPRTLQDLKGAGILTPPVKPMVEFSMAGAATALPKDPANRRVTDVFEFSASSDSQVIVYSYWTRRAQVPKGEVALTKGEVSATIIDASNKTRAVSTPIKVSLKPAPDQQRVHFAWPLTGLTPGFYRVDLCWDGVPAWRAYIRIVD
jgi:hypothetical protein